MEYKYSTIYIFFTICFAYRSFIIVRLTNKLIKLTNLNLKFLGGCSPMVGRQFVALKVVGSSPTTYPLVKVTFFQKNKIKKRVFKKKHHLANLIIPQGVQKTQIYKNILSGVFYNYIQSSKDTLKSIKYTTGFGCFLTQRFNNPKAVIYINKNLNTFSVGSIIKYFKVKQSKCLRRSTRGLKIFLNFLQNIVHKKYVLNKPKYLTYNISGLDYSLLASRKNIKNFFKHTPYINNVYLLCNLKISFTNQKGKRVKSIKKRLKKKILLNFLRKINV